MPQLNFLLTNRALNLVKCNDRETTKSFYMGSFSSFFFFFLEVAVLSNARTLLLKIEGQLEDQKDDIFLVSCIALKNIFYLAQRPSHKSSKQLLLNAWFASHQKLLPVQKRRFF